MYERELKELTNSIGSNLTGLYQYLTKNSGMNITSDLDVETLYNILEIEVHNTKSIDLLISIIFF